MWRLLAILLLATVAAPARAEPAGCAALLRHVPAADTAYRPGVDVRGRRVAPADLYAQPRIPAQGRVFIDVTVPLAALRGAARRKYDTSEVYIGEVAVDLATGDLWFDGQPLNGPDSAALLTWCRGGSGLPPLPAHKPTP